MTLVERVARLPTLVALQVAYFFAFARWPARVENDNTFYEVPAFLLATGRGLSMPTTLFADPTVIGWICAAHPSACPADAYPTAAYPPGYAFFIATHYAIFGRNPSLVLVSHLALLVVFCFVAEGLARKLLDARGATFVIGVLCIYPFIARQAALFMSDHLHLVLLTGALGAWHLMKPGVVRGAAFGALLIAATLTRPYTMFAVVILCAAWPLWKRNGATKTEWLVGGAAAIVPWALWIARNHYWFGRVVPLSTTGLGATLYSMVLEVEIGSIYTPGNDVATFNRLNQFGRFAYAEPNKMLTAASLAWMQEHPLRTIGLLAWHAPKLWISLGVQGEGLGLQALAMGVPMAGLFGMGLAGMWRVRRDVRYWPMLVIVLTYWAFLLPSPEARRTLPLRLPMLLFAGAVVAKKPASASPPLKARALSTPRRVRARGRNARPADGTRSHTRARR